MRGSQQARSHRGSLVLYELEQKEELLELFAVIVLVPIEQSSSD